MSQATAARVLPAGLVRARFSVDEADRAFEVWGANCGPGALAGVLGLTLEQVRPHLGNFESKGYTNPSLMYQALTALKIPFRRVLGRRGQPRAWPSFGLVRIQWHGPWMKPGTPGFVKYRHTHWVGAATVAGDVWVFDINCACVGGWVPLQEWSGQVVPWLLKQVEPQADGSWSLAGVVEVTLPGREAVS